MVSYYREPYVWSELYQGMSILVKRYDSVLQKVTRPLVTWRTYIYIYVIRLISFPLGIGCLGAKVICHDCHDGTIYLNIYYESEFRRHSWKKNSWFLSHFLFFTVVQKTWEQKRVERQDKYLSTGKGYQGVSRSPSLSLAGKVTNRRSWCGTDRGWARMSNWTREDRCSRGRAKKRVALLAKWAPDFSVVRGVNRPGANPQARNGPWRERAHPRSRTMTVSIIFQLTFYSAAKSSQFFVFFFQIPLHLITSQIEYAGRVCNTKKTFFCPNLWFDYVTGHVCDRDDQRMTLWCRPFTSAERRTFCYFLIKIY